MARKLDPKISAVLKEHEFGPEACWDCHGTWVIYHRVLEEIAAKNGIAFDPPLALEADGHGKCVALCVTGRMADKAEWSIGEAAPGNNKNAYPFAMAEKRGKDRVILKLIGLHGLAYSEEEADEFRQSRVTPHVSEDELADSVANYVKKTSEDVANREAGLPVTQDEWKAWAIGFKKMIDGAHTMTAWERIMKQTLEHRNALEKVSFKAWSNIDDHAEGKRLILVEDNNTILGGM